LEQYKLSNYPITKIWKCGTA